MLRLRRSWAPGGRAGAHVRGQRRPVGGGTIGRHHPDIYPRRSRAEARQCHRRVHARQPGPELAPHRGGRHHQVRSERVGPGRGQREQPPGGHAARLQRRAHGRVAGNDGVGAGLAGHPGRRPLPDRCRRGDGLPGGAGLPGARAARPGQHHRGRDGQQDRRHQPGHDQHQPARPARPGPPRPAEPAPQPQPHRGGEHGPPGWFGRRSLAQWRGLRLAGFGLAGLRLAGLGPAGLRRWLGRARRAGPLLPPERVEELRRQGPDVRRRQAGLTRRTGPRGLPAAAGKAGTAPTAGTGQRAAWAARPVWAGAGRAARAPGAGPAEARRGPPGRLPGPRRRPRRRRRCPAALAGSRWSARRLTAAHARQRRPRCPRAVKADRYAIACLCPPGHMEPDQARDPPGDSGTYWDIHLQPE